MPNIFLLCFCPKKSNTHSFSNNNVEHRKNISLPWHISSMYKGQITLLIRTNCTRKCSCATAIDISRGGVRVKSWTWPLKTQVFGFSQGARNYFQNLTQSSFCVWGLQRVLIVKLRCSWGNKKLLKEWKWNTHHIWNYTHLIEISLTTSKFNWFGWVCCRCYIFFFFFF